MKSFLKPLFPLSFIILASCFSQNINVRKHASDESKLTPGHSTVKAVKTFQVKNLKNIELFGLMMQLDMGPDLVASKDSLMIDNRKAMWRDWFALGYKNFLRYKQYDSSAVMQLYRQLLAKNMYNDFFIGFLEQVDEVPAAKLAANTDVENILPFSPSGNLEEAKQNATAFLNEFNKFYGEINFGTYLEENKDYYARIRADVEKNLPGPLFIPTMESFYKKSFNGYCLIPSLNIPTSMGFGKMSKTTKTIYNAFGPFSFQTFDKNDPRLGFDFPQKIQALSVHEFGHSFVNPAIDSLPDELKRSTEYLYAPIKELMTKKAYTNWTMCLYEHFVGAGEIVVGQKLGTISNVKQRLSDNVKSGFIYMPFIVNELQDYDKNPDPNKSYTAFVRTTLEKLKEINRP